MPKRRDTGRRTPPGPEESARPPEQAEVERAIQSVVERLKPKPRKPGAPTRKADRTAGAPGRLSFVLGGGGEGA